MTACRLIWPSGCGEEINEVGLAYNIKYDIDVRTPSWEVGNTWNSANTLLCNKVLFHIQYGQSSDVVLIAEAASHCARAAQEVEERHLNYP